MSARHAFCLSLVSALFPALAWADPPQELSVEQLAERGRKSVVVISSGGRDGR
jgi:S-adenosylmethionine:diacylglycerol 3-amino-3-carboxypropyl transferase